MSEIYVIVQDSVVTECIAVNTIADLAEIYPTQDYKIIAKTGDETIGWTYDGVTFTPPKG